MWILVASITTVWPCAVSIWAVGSVVMLRFIVVGLYAGGEQGCLSTGLMLVLLYGREGWFSPVLRAAGFNVVFAFPGIFHTCDQCMSASESA